MKNDQLSGGRQAAKPWFELLLAPDPVERDRRLLPLAAAVLCFFLANGFSYVNYFPIHDAIGFVAGGATRNWQLQLGRFLIPVYMAARGPLSVPLLTGALSALFLGVSVFLISHILGFRTRFQLFLTAGFLSVNLFTLEISTVHQYFADVFLLALLFCCLGIRIILHRTDLRSFLLSVFFLFVSFGLYPAFLTTAVWSARRRLKLSGTAGCLTVFSGGRSCTCPSCWPPGSCISCARGRFWPRRALPLLPPVFSPRLRFLRGNCTIPFCGTAACFTGRFWTAPPLRAGRPASPPPRCCFSDSSCLSGTV